MHTGRAVRGCYTPTAAVPAEPPAAGGTCSHHLATQGLGVCPSLSTSSWLIRMGLSRSHPVLPEPPCHPHLLRWLLPTCHLGQEAQPHKHPARSGQCKGASSQSTEAGRRGFAWLRPQGQLVFSISTMLCPQEATERSGHGFGGIQTPLAKQANSQTGNV